jgi:hypothetical protein
MATELQVARAAHMASLVYDKACALQFAPRNRWERDWQAFKARARALRTGEETAAQRAAVAVVAIETVEHFAAEVRRHNAMTFQEQRAAAREDQRKMGT